jgi:predicted PurR-regulated permease PerM
VNGSSRVRFWLIVFVLFMGGLYLLSEILLPFVAGIILAYLLDPLADWMERHKLPRWAAAGLITLIAAAGVIAAFLLLVPLLQGQLVELANKIPQYIELLRDRAVELVALVQSELSAEELAALKSKIGGLAGPNALAWIGGLVGKLWGGGLALVNLLSLLVITPIVLFYLLRDWDRIVETVDGWLPRPQAPVIREQVKAIDDVLAAFLRGQFSVCLLLGIFYAVGLTAIGLDFGLIIGFVTGLISFVPYFGMLIGFAVGLGIAAVQFGSWEPMAMVAGVFVVGQFLEGNFITLKLVGDKVGLHPVWIIFGLLAGGAVFGITGILLAVPAAAVIGVLGRFAIRQYRDSGAFLGDDRAPEGDRPNGPDAPDRPGSDTDSGPPS